MIIWINGPFGSGKTHTAHELKRRLKHASIFDPEEVGFFIRKRLAKNGELPDFQDYKLWRDSTISFLDTLDDSDDECIIVPMTVIKPEYLNEILEPLRVNHTVHHFSLMASKETLQKRLLKRGDKKGDWTYKNVELCLNNLNDDLFKEHLYTDDIDLYQVVEFIGEKLNLNLLEDNRNRIHKKIDRLITTAKHIRF